MTSIAIYAYIKRIQQLIPVLYQDLTFIVIKYIIDDVLNHLVIPESYTSSELFYGNSICLDVYEGLYVQWSVRNEIMYDIRFQSINVINIRLRGCEYNDRKYYEFTMYPLDFVKNMNESRMNRELRKQFQTRYYRITKSIDFVDILDQVAREIDFAFTMLIQKITERL